MKLGVTGTAEISHLWTEAALRAGFELAGVCSRDERKGRAFGEKYGCKDVYAAVGEMARHVDVVYIATPPALHYGNALDAIGAGAHVIVEKPCFRGVAETGTIFEAAQRRGVIVLEAMRLFYSPLTQALIDALPQIGPVRYAYFNYMRYSSKYDDFKAGVVASSFSKELGGGALSDLGVYTVYAALMLFGKPDTVLSRVIPLTTGADGACSLILGYHTFNCVISASKQSTSHIPSEVQGEKASLLIGNPFLRSDVSLAKDGGQIVIARQDYNDMLYQQKALYEILSARDEARIERAHQFMLDSAAVLEMCGAAGA